MTDQGHNYTKSFDTKSQHWDKREASIYREIENGLEKKGLTGEEVGLVYADIPFGTERHFRGPSGEYRDVKPLDVLEFCHQIMHEYADAETIIMHCDHRAKWRLADGIYGLGAPDHEIVWCYRGGGASGKSLPKKHDTLMVYNLKGSYYKPVRVPYADPKNSCRPGFSPDGAMASSWWDMGIISTTGNERTGYPTQKPLALMERVLMMWANPEKIVVDPCMGSGTTLVAAEKMGLDWRGFDVNPTAVDVAKQRLDGEI